MYILYNIYIVRNKGEIKMKNGYEIVSENGKSYLHISKELNDTLQKSKVLGDQMVQLMIQKNIAGIVID